MQQSPERPCDNGDKPSLPPWARLPLTRCNLPAVILGGLTFQRHPTPLAIDGVEALHRDLLRELAGHHPRARREEIFSNYMAGQFSLERPEEAGWAEGMRRNADYRRILRGWSFDSDNREAAVLKAWVESRFGLRTLHHRVALRDDQEAYERYRAEAAAGLYNTNALEHQLDLLFAFCQAELRRRHGDRHHITLYRGINSAERCTLMSGGSDSTVLLNNINSFTRERERAEEFGDHILTVEVPLAKVVCFSGLLRGMLRGEQEYVVLGGVHRAAVEYF